MTTKSAQLERQWVRLGVSLNCDSATQSPDLERLLLDTARHVSRQARLLSLSVTWLAQYSNFVAYGTLEAAMDVGIRGEIMVEAQEAIDQPI